jgi:translocation and assembly module TamA
LRHAVTGLLASLLVAAPWPALGQPRDADAALEALIPDEAIENPEGWAGQPPASQASPANAAEPEPPLPLAPLPEIDLAWPGDSEMPAVEPLAPEPDIQVAESTMAAEVEGLTGGTAPEAPRLTGAEVHRIGDDIEIAIAASAGFAERQAFEERFAALSALNRLDDDQADNPAQIARRAKADRNLLLQMLRVYGYYDGEVYQGLGGRSPAHDGATPTGQREVVVRFDVVPGPRYTYGAVELGDLAGTGSDFPRLRRSFAIETGQPISSDAIIEEHGDLASELGETGYAFARVGDPDLLVDHDRRQGDLTIPVTTGGRYAFGPVVSSLPRFLGSRHLAGIARFDPGDTYRLSLVEDLRRAILATGIVSSVTVTPRETRRPAPGEPGTIALDVAISKAPLRTVAGLAGYSSGEGVRAEVSWEHRNLFPPEGRLRVRGILGTREQLAGVGLRRNNWHGRDKVLSFDLFAHTQDRDAYKAHTVSFLATFERQQTLLYQKQFVWSLGLEAVATREREGDVNGVLGPRQTYFIGALPSRIAFDFSDDLLDPTRGFRAALRVSPEMSVLNGGHSQYVRVQGDASLYRPLSEAIVLAGRARLGTITGAGITSIAPSRRFYAGGGGSVRGYGFQRIGPRNAADKPSGGRSLSELSVEARVRTGLFGGALSLVPFIDAGAVDENPTPTLSDLRFGAGVGLRYATSFGPLRVDVGAPLNRRQGDSPIGVYVALGQAF